MTARIASLLLLVGLAGWASPASAKDMTGRFGIGADVPIAHFNGGGVLGGFGFRLPGFSFVYQASRIFGIQGIFGLNIGTNDLGGQRSTFYDSGISFRGKFTVIETTQVNFDIVGGLTALQSGVHFENGGGNSQLGIATEVGIRPEWFVVDDHLSIHTQVGAFIALPDQDEVDINLLGSVNLLGNAGFTFYF